jgi:hypothetical protein
MGRTRRDRLEERREDAKERQEVADQRTPHEQLARLDRMFGPGQGAKKERAKLAKKIASSETTNKSKKKDNEGEETD